MSGHSLTMTFVCNSERRDGVLAGLPDGDLWAINDLAEDDYLSGRSRNNKMEWALHHLIRECRLPDLQHLQSGFDAATGTPLGGWWPTWLAPAELPPAIAALDALLECARNAPEHVLAVLCDDGIMYGCDPDALRAFAGAVPASWADGRATYRKADTGDNDDVLSLVGFVHAHRAMLNLARERDEGAMYLLWLY